MTIIATTTSTFGCGSVAQRLAEMAAAGVQVISNPHGRRLKSMELAQLTAGHQVAGIVAGTESWGLEQFQAMTGLKALVRCGAGTENVDAAAAAACGVITDATFDAPSQAVAELSLALILAALRHIPEHHAGVASGEWKRMLGGNLGGRTVGIIGCGRIGQRLGTLLKGFGVRLLGYDSFRNAAGDITLVPLAELLQRSDVISLHLPSLPSPLIGREAISVMRPGAIVVNTSRGSLVDEAAIAEAVAAGRIRYAADVYAEEPYRGVLVGMPGVIHLPHVGSFTEETRERMEHEALDRLAHHLGVGLGTSPVSPGKSSPAVPEAVFFDMDGVLLDSVRIKEEGFVALFPGAGAEAVQQIRAYHNRHGGMSRFAKIRHFLALLGRPVEEREVAELAERFAARVAELVAQAPIIAGADETLRSSPCPLFVVSGTPEAELRRIVVARGWTRHFSGVYGSPKGKADILREIVATYGFEPGRCLFIGDALGDLEAASEVRMPFVGVNVAFAPSDTTRVRADLQGFWTWLHGERAQQSR